MNEENKVEKVITMDELTKLISDAVDVEIRAKGLDKPDRKSGVFDTNEDANMDKLKDLPKDEKVAKFFQALIAKDDVRLKALSEGTAADGGYLVPVEFRNVILEKLYKESVIRQRATVIPMRRDKLDLPAEAGAVSVYWTAENTALTESSPTLGTVQLNTNKLTGLTKTSRELFDDAVVNLTDFLANLFVRAFKTEEDKVFMAGDGVGKPKGIRTYTITSIAQAGANLVADDLKKLFFSLPVQYRNRATWLLPNGVIQLISTLKDSTGRYLWSDGLNDAEPTLMGRPVVEQNDIPTNLGAGTNESEIFFGDLTYYLIGDRQEITVETTTEGAGAFENHQLALKVIERIDGQLGLTDAFRKLTAVK